MNNEKKSIAYRIGQCVGITIGLCICALIIGVTVAILMRMF
jgi:hypothetical protein